MSRLSRQNKILLQLSRNHDIDHGNLELTFKALTEAASAGLGVERASIWIFNEDQSAIICLDLYEANTEVHLTGQELKSADFPHYFRHLLEERTISADNAHTNPATFEFSEVYLKPLKIKSMLDAPIRKNGKMIGVICSEKVNRLRKWSMADQAFAASLADLISRAMVAHDRLKAKEELKALNDNLEAIVEQRTRELNEQRAATIQAAKLSSLGEMSAGIAHEINTPLAFIQLCAGQLSSLAKSDQLTPERLCKMANNIEAMTKRIAAIIKSLQSFSRDTANDPCLETRIDELIEGALILCSQKLLNTNIDLKKNLCSSRILCRAPEIQQVIMNLISNSIDAIIDLPQDRWICIDSMVVGESIEVAVTDSGPGIEEKIRDKIMQPFFTTKDIGKGTGLGLSVSLGIIKRHGGRFYLDTKSCHTRFVISLPLQPQVNDQAA